MPTKLFAALAATVVAFLIGLYVGIQYTAPGQNPLPPDSSPNTELISSLRQEIISLKGRVAQAEIDQARLTAASRATPAPPSRSSAQSRAGTSETSLSRGQIQRAVLNNLRQLAAAFDQYMLETGKTFATLQEIVGEQKYVRRLDAVDGEDYTAVSIAKGQPMRVITTGGLTITYDTDGPSTTVPEPSPEETRVGDQLKRLNPAIQQAIQAYGATHSGQRPPTPEGLIPFFSNPQEAADFIEALEAQKALRR